MLPRFHNLVPLLGHGPVNDYLIPSPTPICVHFSTISTFRSPEAHLNSDILREGLFGAVSSFSCCTLLPGNTEPARRKHRGNPLPLTPPSAFSQVSQHTA